MVMDTTELSVSYTGGWSIQMPAMPPKIGQRSQATRVISERLDATGQYIVTFEGIAGRTQAFMVKAPTGDRRETVTFPSTSANADGYTSVTLTFR